MKYKIKAGIDLDDDLQSAPSPGLAMPGGDQEIASSAPSIPNYTRSSPRQVNQRDQSDSQAIRQPQSHQVVPLSYFQFD